MTSTDEPNNLFYNPALIRAGNSAVRQAFALGTIVQLNYTTNFPGFEIALIPNSTSPKVQSEVRTILTVHENEFDTWQTYNWTCQSYTVDVTVTPTFSFVVLGIGDFKGPNSFSSGFFNITLEPSNTSSTSSSSSTSKLSTTTTLASMTLSSSTTTTSAIDSSLTSSSSSAPLSATTSFTPSITYSSSSSSSIAPHATPTAATSFGVIPTSTPASTSARLSTGATAGTAVGSAVVGGIIVTILIYFTRRFLRKRRRSQIHSFNSDTTRVVSYSPLTAASAFGMYPHSPAPEPKPEIHELPGHQ